MSTAIDMFLRQVSLTGGIPFKVALPEVPRSIDVDVMGDEQLRDVLLRGLKEAGDGEGSEVALGLSNIRGELFGA